MQTIPILKRIGDCSASLWRRCLVAFFLGLLAALAFPPFNLVPLLWVSFPALVFLLQAVDASPKRHPREGGDPESASARHKTHMACGRRPLDSRLRGNDEKRDEGENCCHKSCGESWTAFFTGWSFAFGLLTLSLYWIAGSLFVDIKSFWWVLPFAIAGLPALFSIYYGLAAALAHRWGLHRLSGVFFLALTWFLADIARGHLFTGFPWDITGYVWGDCLSVLQVTRWIGIEGLSLLTLILALAPAAFFVTSRRKAATILASAVLVFVALAAGGAWRLHEARESLVPDVRLRLVQPGTDQAMKWRADQRLANFNALLDLTFDAPSEKPITHYIWPETATAFYLAEEPEARAAIARRMPPGSVLLTGVVRRQVAPDGKQRYYNSLVVMNAKGAIVGGYDKHHLVPFGEYMPWRSIVPFRVITALGTDFTPGPGIRTVRAPDLPPFGALICYEAIFSGEVVEENDPPQFLLNVTNDAWYDGTIGPAQHFAIARVRAIEEGLPLVRVANKGVTTVVDPYGKTTALAQAKGKGYVDANLPRPLARNISFENKRSFLPWLIVVATFAILSFSRRFQKTN